MLRKEDKFLEGQILDKIRQCQDKHMLTYTPFLDLHEQSFAQQLLTRELKKVEIRAFFFGGYEEAMRRMLFFIPEYLEETWKECLEDILSVVKVKKAKDPHRLEHRDYLGAFVGLGIKREMMGDILVQEQGADIVVCKDILGVVLEQYKTVGRSSVTLEEKALSEIVFSEEERETKRLTVASNRLDNILSGCFQSSRSEAQAWIQKGIVYVNYVEKYKNEFPLQAGDIVVVRGEGKIKLEEFGALTKKEKLPLYYIKY